MSNSTDRKPTEKKKVANIYLDPLTHETIKQLSAHQSSSMQTVIASWLDDTQPVMAEMVKALEDIKSGKDTGKIINNLLAKGLLMASEELTTQDNQHATDNWTSD